MRADFIQPEFYTLTEAATVANVSKMTLRRAVDRDELATYRFGRKVLIKRDAFRNWLESKRA
jgi:excisionase family DNA binding protein